MLIAGTIILTAGIIATIFRLRKKANENADNTQNNPKDVPFEIINNNNYNTSNTKPQQLVITATITQQKAIDIADRLYEAMSGFGTDEKTILSLLKPLNKADLELVTNKFGLRKGKGPLAKSENLIEWLKSELSGADLQQVSEIFYSNNLNF